MLAGIGGVDPPAYNVIQSCVDAKASHIFANKVRPFFLTERGDAALKEKAQGMQRAVESVFDENGVYGSEGLKVCYDGLLFDAGLFKGWPDYQNLRFRIDRVFPWECFVSDREARYGKPRQLFHVFLMDRDVLLKRFEGDERIEALIRDAQAAGADELEESADDKSRVPDQLMVCETWHLPSGAVDRSKPEAFGRDAKGNEVEPSHDGWRCLCIDGGELALEPWPFPYFPIAMFRPKPRVRGFWSRGLPEILAGNQLALNKMARRIDGILNLHARPLLYVWRKAKVNKRHITNSWASIIEGNAPPGQALQYIVPQSVPGDYIRRYREIIDDAERQAGVSGLSIAAEKPAGVEHAPALQHLQDLESLRHTPDFRAWESLHVDLGRCVVDGLRLLTEYAKREGKSLELLHGESKQLTRLKPEDWALPENRAHLKVWPTNLLPQTPGAKITRIITMIQGGILPPEKALQALAIEFPDIEALLGDATAAERNIEERLKNLEAGEAFENNSPEPYMNLELAMRVTIDRINALEADGRREGDEKVDRLRAFYEMAHRLASGESPAQEQPALAGPEGPPGPPGPPGTPAPLPQAGPQPVPPIEGTEAAA